MKITSKGQITIPLALRNRFGFRPNTEVEFVVDRSGVRLVKPKQSSGKGRRLIERMRGRGDSKLSTDAIMKLTRGEG